MFIIIGMPCGRQYQEGTLPGPPAFISASLASNTFIYSGVSGGLCPLPGGIQRGAPTRCHWPLRSGYFAGSAAGAAETIAVSAAAIALAIKLRCSIAVLPLVGPTRRADGTRTPLLVRADGLL